jgi:hypothetical protein
MLERWQRRLNRVVQVDDDPYDSPVNLDDVIAVARELNPAPDDDWH